MARYSAALTGILFAYPWLLPLAILGAVVYSAEKLAIPPGTTRKALKDQQI
jgi:hypothetical protein